MSTAKSIASGYHGSKRVACDRCREQKSRCPRETQTGTSDTGKCARCAKAGAVCNFGTSLRAGRPSTSASKALAKQRKNLASNQPSRQNSDTNLAGPWEALTEESKDRNGDITNREDNLSFLSPDCSEIWMGGSFDDEATHPSSRRTTVSADASHLSRSFNAFSARDIAMLGEEDLDFLKQSDLLNKTLREAEEETSPMDLDPFAGNYNWDLNNPMSSSTSYMSQLRNASFAESPKTMLFTPPETSMSDGSRTTSTNDSRMNSCTNSSEKLAGPGRLPHLHARSADRFQWEGYNPITPSSTTSRTQDGNPDSPPAYHLFPSHDIQHRRMHELSELGLNFYSQVKETASRDEANPLALSLPNNLAVKVLESSVKFLNLLTSLYPTQQPQSPTTNSQSSSSSDEDIPTIPITNHHRSQKPHQRHHPGADDISTRNDFSPQPVDMTEVFALLTCYIRILHLHHLLYSRMSDFLSTLFQRGAHLPPVFPGVQAGTLSLDTFAKFQVKLLIQISTHVLGEIEMALGLPDGYRISKRNRQRQGIFEGSVSVQFIEMTMNEKGKGGLGIEKDRFTSIRDHLGRLRQLLKGTINP